MPHHPGASGGIRMWYLAEKVDTPGMPRKVGIADGGILRPICRIMFALRLRGDGLQEEPSVLLKALRGGQHRRPSIHARQTAAGGRKKACNSKSAIPARRHHGDM